MRIEFTVNNATNVIDVPISDEIRILDYRINETDKIYATLIYYYPAARITSIAHFIRPVFDMTDTKDSNIIKIIYHLQNSEA